LEHLKRIKKVVGDDKKGTSRVREVQNGREEKGKREGEKERRERKRKGEKEEKGGEGERILTF
jgi:hypothetical protein